MSGREDKGGLIQPRAAAEIDDENDILEAIQFAQGKSGPPRLPVARRAMKHEFKALAKRGETMPAQRTMIPPPPLEAPTAMASPEVLSPASENVRDALTDSELVSILLTGMVDSSLVTVPTVVESVRPVVASVRPPDIPPAPALPSFPYVEADETVRVRPMTPAAALVASRDRAVGTRIWAVLVSVAALALPGGLFVRQALISHPPVTAKSPQPVAVAPTVAAETEAPPKTAGDSTGPSPPGDVSPGPSAMSNLNIAWDPVDPRPVVRTPRPTHRGKGKSAPKPAPSTAASASDPSAKYGF